MQSEKTPGAAIAVIIDALNGLAPADTQRVMNCVSAYLNGKPEPHVGRPRGSRNKVRTNAAALTDSQKQPQASLLGTE